jgi:hypothetical protein
MYRTSFSSIKICLSAKQYVLNKIHILNPWMKGMTSLPGRGRVCSNWAYTYHGLVWRVAQIILLWPGPVTMTEIFRQCPNSHCDSCDVGGHSWALILGIAQSWWGSASSLTICCQKSTFWEFCWKSFVEKCNNFLSSHLATCFILPSEKRCAAKKWVAISFC